MGSLQGLGHTNSGARGPPKIWGHRVWPWAVAVAVVVVIVQLLRTRGTLWPGHLKETKRSWLFMGPLLQLSRRHVFHQVVLYPVSICHALPVMAWPPPLEQKEVLACIVSGQAGRAEAGSNGGSPARKASASLSP